MRQQKCLPSFINTYEALRFQSRSSHSYRCDGYILLTLAVLLWSFLTEMLHGAFIIGRQLQLWLFCTELQNGTVHKNVSFGVLYIAVLLSHYLSSHQNTYKQ